MSKNPYEESAFARFSRKKGIYAVFAACLIGAGAAGAGFLSREDNKEEVPNEVKPQVFEKKEQEPIPEEIKFVPKKEEPPKKEEKPKETQKLPEVSVSKAEVRGNLPCKGEITAAFSKGELVKDETMGDWRTHNGIDINAPEGTEVISFASGKVKDVRNDALWGTVVEIQHSGGIVTKYCGLGENVSVSKGGTVRSGEKIGSVANIPCEGAKGAHLHFEVIDKGKYKDPADFVK